MSRPVQAYVIGPRDTILTIARRFGTTPLNLAQLNQSTHRFVRSSVTGWDFAPGTVRVGDRIVVPALSKQPPRQRGRVNGLGDADCGEGQHLVDFGDWVGCVSDLQGQPCGNGGTYNQYGDCEGSSDGGAMDALQKILGTAGGQAAYNAYNSGMDGASFAASLGPSGWNLGQQLCAVLAVVGTVLLGPFGAFLAAMCAAGASMYGGDDNGGGGGIEGQPCKMPDGSDGKISQGTCIVPCAQNEYYDPSDGGCGCERPGFRRLDPNDYNTPCINLNAYPQPCGSKDGDGFYIMEPGGQCLFAGAGDSCESVEPAGGWVLGTFNGQGVCIPDAAKTAAANPTWLCEHAGLPSGKVWFDKLNNVWYCLQPCGDNETLDPADGMCACNAGFKRDGAGNCVKSSGSVPGGGAPPKTQPGKVPPKIDNKTPVVPPKAGGKKEESNTPYYVGAAILGGLALWFGTRKKKSG